MAICMKITRGKYCTAAFPKGLGEEVTAVLKEAGYTEGEFHLNMLKTVRGTGMRGVVVTRVAEGGLTLCVQPQRGSKADRRECYLNYPTDVDADSFNKKFVSAAQRLRAYHKKGTGDVVQVVVQDVTSATNDKKQVRAREDWYVDGEFMYYLLSDIRAVSDSDGLVHYRILAHVVRSCVFYSDADSRSNDPRGRVRTMISANWIVSHKRSVNRRVTYYKLTKKALDLLQKYDDAPPPKPAIGEEKKADEVSETPEVIRDIMAEFAKLPELRKKRDEVLRNLTALREELGRVEAVWGQINKEIGRIQSLESSLKALLSAEEPKTE